MSRHSCFGPFSKILPAISYFSSKSNSSPSVCIARELRWSRWDLNCRREEVRLTLTYALVYFGECGHIGPHIFLAVTLWVSNHFWVYRQGFIRFISTQTWELFKALLTEHFTNKRINIHKTTAEKIRRFLVDRVLWILAVIYRIWAPWKFN